MQTIMYAVLHLLESAGVMNEWARPIGVLIAVNVRVDRPIDVKSRIGTVNGESALWGGRLPTPHLFVIRTSYKSINFGIVNSNFEYFVLFIHWLIHHFVVVSPTVFRRNVRCIPSCDVSAAECSRGCTRADRTDAKNRSDKCAPPIDWLCANCATQNAPIRRQFVAICRGFGEFRGHENDFYKYI